MTAASAEPWRGVLLPVDGPAREVAISRASYGLTDLCSLIGADYVESTRGGDGVVAYVDEDGAVGVPKREVNPRLTEWAARLDDWQLRGPAVLVGPHGPDGDMTSLSDQQVAEYLARWPS